MKEEWTGFIVCKDCFETRHPQDFVRAVKDDPSVAWTRSESTDTETDTSTWLGRTDVPAGTNDGSL